MFPPAVRTTRVCKKPYQIPGTNLVIQPGEFVTIPISGIHMDDEYYPEPGKFDPDRFRPENKCQRHPLAFIPFGAGPRNCIGFRLGRLVAKIAVASIISEFRVTLNERTKTPIKFVNSLVLTVEGGIWINFSRVNG